MKASQREVSGIQVGREGRLSANDDEDPRLFSHSQSECSVFIPSRELRSSAQEGPFEVTRDLSQALLFYIHPETSEGEGGTLLVHWFVRKLLVLSLP